MSEVIGDMAYVSEENLEVCGEDITLIAKTNSAVAAAAETKLEEGFHFNKDAKMLQCPAGELAMRADKRETQNGNQYHSYVFSKKKCNKCPLREQCKVGKGKTHSYSITQVSAKNQARLEFEASEGFQERLRIRHRIEEKNGELKEAHGLGRADSVGLFAMQLQMYFTAFAANIKRMTKLIATVA